MITLLLKPWQHATASLLILILLSGILYISVIRPAVLRHIDFQGQQEEMQLQYSKLNSYLLQANNIEGEIEKLRAKENNSFGFLGAKQQSLAAAELQTILTELVKQNGAELISSQVVNLPATKFPYTEVTLNVVMRGGIESLQKIIYQIEYGRPSLLLKNLQVQSPLTGGNVTDTGNMAPLEVRFDASGFIKNLEMP